MWWSGGCGGGGGGGEGGGVGGGEAKTGYMDGTGATASPTNVFLQPVSTRLDWDRQAMGKHIGDGQRAMRNGPKPKDTAEAQVIV